MSVQLWDAQAHPSPRLEYLIGRPNHNVPFLIYQKTISQRACLALSCFRGWMGAVLKANPVSSCDNTWAPLPLTRKEILPYGPASENSGLCFKLSIKKKHSVFHFLKAMLTHSPSCIVFLVKFKTLGIMYSFVTTDAQQGHLWTVSC